MTDLFRYIEHHYAVPRRTDTINVANDSDFQTLLHAAAEAPDDPGGKVRSGADDFLATNYPAPTADPAVLGSLLVQFASAVQSGPDAEVGQTITSLFGRSASDLAAADDFRQDRALLENAVVAAKLVTGFDRLDAARLQRQVAAVALVVDVAAGAALEPTDARRALARPLRLPATLLAAVAKPPERPDEPDQPDAPELPDAGLRRERDTLEGAYDSLIGLSEDAVEMVIARESDFQRQEPEDRDGAVATGDVPEGSPMLRLTGSAVERLPSGHREALERVVGDVGATAVPRLLESVNRRLTELNVELLPKEVATTAKVFRVGSRLLAEPIGPVPVTLMDQGQGPAAGAPLPAGFAKAVTRPVGYGDLLVVRQELIGYGAQEISHIENILKGEALRHTTTRDELSEAVTTDRTIERRAEERDNQSTDRNELATATQQEAGQQSSRSGTGMTSSDYGRLVENSSSSFARTVVTKSVESLTAEVQRERVRRESHRFTDQLEHTFDNHDGQGHVRGIYQWVDKKFSLRVLNYGRRLMYDVVVPEPAAVLVKALRDAVQPEAFSLERPLDPSISPGDLRESNYAWYAAQYGVTGSVAPPPQVYSHVVAHPASFQGNEKVSYEGQDTFVPRSAAFTLTVPEGYRTVGGYVQRVNAEMFLPEPNRKLEVYIGESTFVRFGSDAIPYLSHSFTMTSQTGDVPVTVKTFGGVVSLPFSIGIICQRTDSAYAVWQLKTHAQIISGYQRMLTEYEDRLARFVTALKVQMAAAGGLAHNPSIVRDELKRAFTFLLLGEHPGTWLPTPSPAPVPPWPQLPDPVSVRDWGAMVAFFERAFEWDNLMFTCYPYFWARPARWEEMLLTQDADPDFEAFLKAGAVRVVVPVRPGFEAALAHFHETGDLWMGEEMPDMFGDMYVSIIDELKASSHAAGEEVCVQQWEVVLPTTLVILKEDATLPTWPPTACTPPGP